MARSKKPRKKIEKPHAPQPMDRRRALKLLRNGGVAAVVVGGTAVFGTRSVLATIAEHDLTRVGVEGKPTVVQIHDPQCPMCRDLQRAARRALGGLEECAIVYLVANIRTQDGAAFAARYGAGHVTLLVFDAAGDLVDTLEGVRPSDELRTRFLTHAT